MSIKNSLVNWFKFNKSYIANTLDEHNRFVNQKKYDTRKLYNLVHENASPVFFLSTGRCGTAWLTEVLNQSKKLDVYHTPVPELIYHSRLPYDNRTDDLKMVVDVARYEYIRNSFLLNRDYVETNNRVTFFAYQLAELYPKAKFVHIIRNPHDFIKSGLPRDWYSGNHLHDEGRIIPIIENINWEDCSLTEKIAWLWMETNMFITNFGKSIDQSRYHILRSEDLFSNVDTISKLLEFVQATDISSRVLKSSIHHKINSSKIKINPEDIKLDFTENKWINMIELLKQFNY